MAGSYRDLHSFPTRRSSDLLVSGDTNALSDIFIHDLQTGITSRASRSEEHTSELQSPCNLVCRLLLEKKNAKQTNTNSPIITINTNKMQLCTRSLQLLISDR